MSVEVAGAGLATGWPDQKLVRPRAWLVTDVPLGVPMVAGAVHDRARLKGELADADVG